MIELPGREQVVDQLAEMLSAAVRRAASADEASDRSCALLLLEVEGYDSLVELDPSGGAQIDGEIARRLDRLVRSSDILGRTAADRYVLAAADVAPAVVGALVDRLRTAFAMPVPVGDGLVSLPVEVAVELAGPPDGRLDPASLAAAMMQRAEQRLARPAG